MTTDQDFRDKTIASLARIETKLDSLVGPDGNNGRVKTLEEDVEDLQRSRWVSQGASGVLGSFIGAAVSMFFQHRK